MNPGKVLVVGGAGYIGSHMVHMLLSHKYEVVVIDDLSSGHCEAVPKDILIKGDVGDVRLLESILSDNEFEAVFHFASFIQVGESNLNPAKYYSNNIANTVSLLAAMVKYNIKKFIFSSTAAIYGDPKYIPIDEVHPISPINPYGLSKAIIEQLLPDYDRAYDMKYVCLRYFNASGAHPDSNLGEAHNPETHLIPLALRVAMGLSPDFKLYGQDYETHDGTCIRDYIHVWDLCYAHLLALNYLRSGNVSNYFNLGNGSGHSVLEVLQAVERVTDKRILVKSMPPRGGDPSCLVADSTKAREILGWAPSKPSIETIVQDAFQWEVNKRF